MGVFRDECKGKQKWQRLWKGMLRTWLLLPVNHVLLVIVIPGDCIFIEMNVKENYKGGKVCAENT